MIGSINPESNIILRTLPSLFVLGLVAGGLGGLPTAAEIPGPSKHPGDTRPAETARPATADTIYYARMEPLLVIGYRIHGVYAGTIPGARRRHGHARLAAAGGQRAPAADSEDTGPDGITVGGLIANETFSVVGARFSRTFEDKWTEPEGVGRYSYTIELQENPVPRFGAQVLVRIEGTTIFRGYLRPNRRQIQQAAERAVQRAALYLRKYYEPREVY